MRALNLKELQQNILEIMVYFDKICRENNLKYFLYGGTLLGAVRHNGFIPWDDDADVMMPLEDYKKLLKVMENDSSQYQLFAPFKQKDYFFPFYKIVNTKTTIVDDSAHKIENYGVYLDIFPFSSVPNDEKKRKKFLKKLKTLQHLHQIKFVQTKNKLKQLAKNFVGGLYTTKSLLKKFDKYMNMCDAQSSLFGGDMVWGEKTFEKSCFDELILHEFEGKQFFIPKEYDKMLTALYGDYMTIPKEEDRKNHHTQAYKLD